MTALSGPVIDELLAKIADYPDVNVIEVIGHTDEQPLVQRPSNLDELLMPVLQGKSSVIRLAPADNAGLGLARAVSVIAGLAEGRTTLPLGDTSLFRCAAHQCERLARPRRERWRREGAPPHRDPPSQIRQSRIADRVATCDKYQKETCLRAVAGDR